MQVTAVPRINTEELLTVTMSGEQYEALSQELSPLERITARIGVDSETVTRAEALYTQVTHSQTVDLNCQNTDCFSAAVVLIACRQTGDVRTPDTIAEHSPEPVDNTRIHAAVKQINSALHLGLVIADATDYVDRVGEILGIGSSDVESARRLVTIVKQRGVGVNRSPRSLASATTYFACTVDRATADYTQREIATALDLNTDTVRRNYSEVRAVLSPEDITHSGEHQAKSRYS